MLKVFLEKVDTKAVSTIIIGLAIIITSYILGSAFKNRNEIIISKQKKVTGIAPHGNNLIPPGGYVLSLPKTYDTSLLKIGVSAECKEENDYHLFDKSTSVLPAASTPLSGFKEVRIGIVAATAPTLATATALITKKSLLEDLSLSSEFFSEFILFCLLY